MGENLLIIAAMVLLFSLLGGMLLYDLITYSPEQIMAFIREGELNMIIGAGIVFYGALAGGVIGALIGSVIAKDDIRDYLDIVVPVIPLGHAIGRIGCFFAGCCYGIPSECAIAVTYTDPVGGAPVGVSLLPVQLFEACADLAIFAVLITVSHKTVSKYLTTILYCVLYGTARFILEFYRFDSIRGIAGGLSTSQWISLFMTAAGIICLIIYLVRRGRKISY